MITGNGVAARNIRRGFVDVSFGQMHFRSFGDGAPLLLLHASPGSSKQLEPLIGELGLDRKVIAPDSPGNGDSSPLPLTAPSAVDYAKAAVEFMDAMNLSVVDVYGSHTGAAVAAELAILAPHRVTRIIQDGAAVFSKAEGEEYLARYARPFTPDLDGAYLMQAFMFCRDQYLFWPWYSRSKAGLRGSGLPSADVLHAWVLEVLKAPTTYPLGYRAAFSYQARDRLPLIVQPSLYVAAEDDPLRPATAGIVPSLRNAKFQALPKYDSGYLPKLVDSIREFLRAADSAN